jgi:DEAD/DEAH box helicase domain-containing protein
MNYHGILDWRLGCSLLRILRGDDGSIPSESFLFEQQQWPQQAKDLATSLSDSFGYTLMGSSGSIPIVEKNQRQFAIVPPLWDFDAANSAVAATISECYGAFDTFNLERRLAWVHQNRRDFVL